ncbi:MAG TPA: hypothetical protein VGF61_03675 [Candidatus Acidoferrum sp.]
MGDYQIGRSFANQGAEYLDGQPLNIGYINLPLVVPTQDSISEGVAAFDFALFKRTYLGPDERFNVEFRTEFFNIFNHPQYGPPSTALGSSTFGQATSTVNNPRLIQFGLKFAF